ncbi:hypothetical protein VTN02DRAFT_5983 [Thermoascus thermophilus]
MSSKGGRSVQGCWTCRLRRKKCDEASPVCFACDSRNIRCHGYGPRPAWMDGGERERAELARIKHGVKRNRRLKRLRAQQLRVLEGQQHQQSPSGQPEEAVESGRGRRDGDGEGDVTTADTATHGPGGTEDSSPFIYEDRENQHEPATALSVTTMPYLSSGSHPPSQSLLPGTIPILHHREAELLMHYLDYVFHLQFRFHSPSIRTGGRGWLLWLLIRTAPLYHAALSLSALHQHTLLHRKTGAQGSPRESKHNSTLQELNDYHGRTLQELQVCLQNSQTDTGSPHLGRQIEILACGVQLISFQLFQGGVSDWQVHVNAVAALISSIEDDRQARLELSGQTSGNTPSPGGSAPSSEDAALNFLTTVVVWFDIAACASTGTAPKLLRHHPALLRSGRADMPNVMGCRAWVIETIGQIAALVAWKEARLARGDGLSVWELVERGRGIQNQLQAGIAGLEAEAETGHDAPDPTTPIQCAVTLTFACAAQVYLHVTVSGAHPSLPEIRLAVSRTLSALHGLIRVTNDRQSIRGVIWPLCIAGCMAEPEESGLADAFRALVVDMGDDAREFGNSSTVLAVMEKCWTERRAGTDPERRGTWDWRRAMAALGASVLLI